MRWIVLLGLATFSSERASAADVRTGEQIYLKRCASCHGTRGEGTPKIYPHALIGDRSSAQLSQLIAKTMPEDKPGSCVGEEADKVAAYIHETFYSKAAQEQNKPPRIELSRLTVRQYRNVLADLVGSFRPSGKIDEKHGLRGEYFNARGFRNDKRVLDRIDPEVKFDFGTNGPQPDKFDPHQFSIRWEGSVLPHETGVHEFIVRTEHGFRIWVNDATKPLIDGWVKSGAETEFRGSLFLLGGRAYTLRLEFSKAKQGVDDSKKNPNPPPVKASIALLWKQPQCGIEFIPSRSLVPNRVPEAYIVTTPFPPDDRSLGWERGTFVSKSWDQATTDAALDAASYIALRINDLAGTKEGAPDRDAKIRDFCRKFVERAFRRPLNVEQKLIYVDRSFDATKDVEVALKRVILFALKSPRFLYREVGGPDAYDTAARLSFALWDSIPDTELMNAVATGQLVNREQLNRQAERMLADPRARNKLHEFLLTWLKVDQVPDLTKDSKRFPGFDRALAADLRTSLTLFLEETAWGNDPDFRKLLLTDHVHLNGRLAKFYGAELPTDAPFQQVKLNSEHRAGVLTHPYLMTTFAYTGTSSPIHRGVFIARGVLGLSLRPPQDAFTPLPEDLHPKLTTRERVALQTKPTACVSCHGIINPLGFTLENFDAVGRYREKENDKKIDSSGSYLSRTGETIAFASIRDLAKYLASSEEVHTSFTEQMFHHLVKQPVRAFGPRRLADLRDSFARNGFNIRKLAVEVAVASALPTEIVPPKKPE